MNESVLMAESKGLFSNGNTTKPLGDVLRSSYQLKPHAMYLHSIVLALLFSISKTTSFIGIVIMSNQFTWTWPDRRRCCRGHKHCTTGAGRSHPGWPEDQRAQGSPYP